MTGFFKAARLAAEYSGAFVSAMKKAEDGAPLIEVLREFARGTEGELDDHAVESLAEAVEEGLAALNNAVVWAGKVAFWLEDTSPKAIESIAAIGAKALSLSLRLQSLK